MQMNWNGRKTSNSCLCNHSNRSGFLEGWETWEEYNTLRYFGKCWQCGTQAEEQKRNLWQSQRCGFEADVSVLLCSSGGCLRLLGKHFDPWVVFYSEVLPPAGPVNMNMKPRAWALWYCAAQKSNTKHMKHWKLLLLDSSLETLKHWDQNQALYQINVTADGFKLENKTLSSNVRHYRASTALSLPTELCRNYFPMSVSLATILTIILW